MPSKAKPRKNPSALDHLGPEETAPLLAQLLMRHPELRAEAEALALRMITAVDPEDVSEALEFAFSGIGPDEFRERAGGRDAAPFEASGTLCEEALAPFLKGLKRLLAMGLADPALAQTKGLLLGLHDLKVQLPPDAAAYCSDKVLSEVLEAWAGGRPVEADAPLLAWIGDVLPDWSGAVEPRLERLRKPVTRIH